MELRQFQILTLQLYFHLTLLNQSVFASSYTDATTMDYSSAQDRKEVMLVPDEQRLLNRVFRNLKYDNSIRPVYNATTSVQVRFGMTLIQIMDMEEKNQVLVTNVWLEHEWRDERIQWNPQDYNNLQVLRVPASKLWLPDIVLYNNADDFTTGYMPSNAMVHSDGTVFWSPPARLRSSCKIDITLFPFDQQECTLKFGSWTYDKAQVDIIKKEGDMNSPHYITNGEWALVYTSSIRNEVVYPISPAVYPDVTITIVIHRRILYYILNIILPCVWLNMLSLLAFCLPPDAGEKITLGITVLLSYSVFMLLVAENMPATSEFVPLIGIYLTISMAMTSISVILTVGILKLHHCSPHQKRVPPWIRTVVLRGIASCIRCKCVPAAPRSRYSKQEVKLSKEGAEMCLRLVNQNVNGRQSPITEMRQYACHRPVNKHEPRFQNVYDNTMTENNLTSNGRDQNSDLSTEMRRLNVMEEILRYLQIMVAKKDEDDAEIDVMNEWRQVAQVIDRFLFLLFFTFTTLTTVIMMVLIPMFSIQ